MLYMPIRSEADLLPLVQAALDAGGSDNITAMYAFREGEHR